MFTQLDAIRKSIEAKLVDDAGKAWRWTSVRAMALDTAFLITWATIPDDLKAALPSWLVPVAASAVLVIGVIGRVLKQKDPDHDTPAS